MTDEGAVHRLLASLTDVRDAYVSVRVGCDERDALARALTGVLDDDTSRALWEYWATEEGTRFFEELLQGLESYWLDTSQRPLEFRPRDAGSHSGDGGEAGFRSKRGLWLALGVVLALLATGAGAWALQSRSATEAARREAALEATEAARRAVVDANELRIHVRRLNDLLEQDTPVRPLEREALDIADNLDRLTSRRGPSTPQVLQSAYAQAFEASGKLRRFHEMSQEQVENRDAVFACLDAILDENQECDPSSYERFFARVQPRLDLVGELRAMTPRLLAELDVALDELRSA